MSEQTIVTLLIEEGRKGDAIGSYSPEGRRRGSIVFLPPEAKARIGGNARVILEMIHEDSRGQMMYNGRPAPVEYTKRWKDNGDGTASEATIQTDWLGQEKVWEEQATKRPLAKREGSPSTQSNLQVVWGADLATSVVEDRQTRLIPLEEEKVEGGQIVWKKTGERHETLPTISYPITKVSDINQQVAIMALVQLRWEEWNFDLRLQVYYEKNGVEQSTTVLSKWENLPAFVQVLLQRGWPVCMCGRERVAVGCGSTQDGYLKCAQCRSEETCVRCGQRTSIILVNGRMICSDCYPLEEAEQKIKAGLPMEVRQKQAELARLMQTGQALEQAAGEAVLAATASHLQNPQNLMAAWKGYPWYYFTSQGVYGSIFPPAALQLLEMFPQATGNWLVELVSWFPDAHTSTPASLYFIRTQVLHQEAERPPVDHQLYLLNDGRMQAGIKLRGSENDRIAATAGYQKLVEIFGADSDQAKAVAAVLQGNEQDYAAAVSLIEEFTTKQQQRQEAAARGEIWLDVAVDVATGSQNSAQAYCVAPDGSIVEPKGAEMGGHRDRHVAGHFYGDVPTDHIVVSHEWDTYGYRYSESWTVVRIPRQVTLQQQLTLQHLTEEGRQFFIGPTWDLRQVGSVSYTTAYSRDMQGDDRVAHDEQYQSFPIDMHEYEQWIGQDPYFPQERGEGVGTETVVIGPHKRRSPEAKRLAELRRQLADLEQTLNGLEQAREYQVQDYEAAEVAALDRLEATYHTREVVAGDVFEVEFHEERRQAEPQLAAGPIWDNASGSWIKLVEDPYSGSRPVTGKRCLVKVRARNSQQVGLFRYNMPNPDGPQGQGGRMVTVTGYFATVIASPEDFDRDIAEAQAAIETLKAELAGLEAAPVELVKPAAGTLRVQIPQPNIVHSYGEDEAPMSAMEAALRAAAERAEASEGEESIRRRKKPRRWLGEE